MIFSSWLHFLSFYYHNTLLAFLGRKQKEDQGIFPGKFVIILVFIGEVTETIPDIIIGYDKDRIVGWKWVTYYKWNSLKCFIEAQSQNRTESMKYEIWKNKTVYLDVCQCMERQGGDITRIFKHVNYLFLTWSIVNVQCYRRTTWWFTIFKGFTPFIVILTIFLWFTLYPCILFILYTILGTF